MSLPPMSVPIPKPVKIPKLRAAHRPHKPHKNKGMPNKNTANGIWRQELIFSNRTTSILGLTSDEMIARYHNINIKKVEKLSTDARHTLWNEIRTINKWMRKSHKMAIVYKKLKKGTIIYNPPGEDPLPELGIDNRRQLTRHANVYFRGMKYVDTTEFTGINDKISHGIVMTNQNTHEIVIKEEEEEQQRKEEQEVLEKLAPKPMVASVKKKSYIK